jgi:hypothetical protein
MLLIYPPVAKACEPPAGIARLAAHLRANGVPCTLLDANLEAQLFLLRGPVSATDTWSRRAGRNVERNIAALRDAGTYRTPDRYRRAVHDLSRVLSVSGGAQGAAIGLADYQHDRWSPVRSGDLLAAAERPEQNPFFPYFSRRLAEVVERERPRMIGFSVNFLNQALCAFAMLGFTKRRFPGIPIVLGGGLITSWMKSPGWTDPFAGLADRCISGPGEGPLLALLGVEEGRREPQTPDLGALPVSEYFSPGTIVPYSGAEGCFWRTCSFCPENAEGSTYRPVPVRRALDEIRALADDARPALIHLLDNAISPSLLRGLAAEPPGAPWYGFTRIGPELADPDFCGELKRAGCVLLKLGLESGDQEVLDELRKGIDLGTASQVLRNLRNAGIATYVYLLFGTPPEDEEAARRTLAFTAAHAGMIGFLNLAVFNLPVCSADAAVLETGPFSDGDLSLYTAFRHPRGWDRKRVRTFLDREFIRHSAIAPIVRNDPPVFTSNHSPFFAGTRIGQNS